MKKSRFSDEQVAHALRQAEAGTPVADIVAQTGHLRSHVLCVEKEVRHDGYGRNPRAATAARREQQAQTARRRSGLGQDDAPGCHLKKMVAPMRRRFALPYLRKAYKISERRACQVAAVNRSTVQYKSREDRRAGAAGAHQRDRRGARALRLSANSRAAASRRLGRQPQARVPHLPRRRPSMRLKPPRRRNRSCCAIACRAQAVNQTWSMDFMADNLVDGRKIRLLTIVDNFSRECLSLEVGLGLQRYRCC